MIKALMLFASLTFSVSLLAQETESPDTKSEKTVKWYQPKLGYTDSPSRTRVILSGKTEPNATVSISDKAIPIVINGKQKYFKKTYAFIKDKDNKTLSEAKTDGEGFFTYTLDLPEGLALLPLKVSYQDQTEKDFQLNLQISFDKVDITNLGQLESSPLFKKDYALWLGVGATLLTYEQISEDIPLEQEFESFKSPAFYFKYWMNLSTQWDFSIEYKNAPGVVEDNETFTYAEKDYSWSFYGLDFQYNPSEWVRANPWGKTYMDLGIMLGVQYHQLPFITRLTASTAEITQNNMYMLSLGGKLTFYTNDTWLYEIFVRRQLPLTTGSSFNATPTFTLDGSLGVSYKLSDNWRVGLFWYGQYQQHNYEKHKDFSEGEVSGNQKFFFSNAEVRFGYEW
ncbi:MAG: hypothetical protein MK008_07625 [Bdellovibrionales bacterium]|nr:hypothetical protein [Bdellovibrionales bacterium]